MDGVIPYEEHGPNIRAVVGNKVALMAKPTYMDTGYAATDGAVGFIVADLREPLASAVNVQATGSSLTRRGRSWRDQVVRRLHDGRSGGCMRKVLKVPSRWLQVLQLTWPKHVKVPGEDLPKRQGVKDV